MNPLQDMIRYGKFSIPEVLVQIAQPGHPKKRLFRDKYMVKMTSQRYKVFWNNHSCVSCGIEGKYFILEMHKNCVGNSNPHFNLYAVDENGDEILMTKDHIIPKAKGGSNKLNNLQTMCSRCNQEKRDSLPEEFGC
jgi:5-methylcytosine-specific restriction endonuclease McrA